MSDLQSVKVVIRTRDIVASREFYTSVLGLAVLEEWNGKEGNGFIVGFGEDGGLIESAETPRGSERFDESFTQPALYPRRSPCGFV